MSGTALLSYATKAAMVADLSQANGTFAEVVIDTTVFNNGTYQYSTGTSTWSSVLPLNFSLTTFTPQDFRK